MLGAATGINPWVARKILGVSQPLALEKPTGVACSGRTYEPGGRYEMRQHPPARHRARNHMRHRTKDRYQCLYKVRSGGNIPMKRFLSFLVQVGVLAAGLVCGAQLFAQEPGSVPETSAPPPVQGPGGGRRGMM